MLLWVCKERQNNVANFLENSSSSLFFDQDSSRWRTGDLLLFHTPSLSQCCRSSLSSTCNSTVSGEPVPPQCLRLFRLCKAQSFFLFFYLRAEKKLLDSPFVTFKTLPVDNTPSCLNSSTGAPLTKSPPPSVVALHSLSTTFTTQSTSSRARGTPVWLLSSKVVLRCSRGWKLSASAMLPLLPCGGKTDVHLSSTLQHPVQRPPLHLNPCLNHYHEAPAGEVANKREYNIYFEKRREWGSKEERCGEPLVNEVHAKQNVHEGGWGRGREERDRNAESESRLWCRPEEQGRMKCERVLHLWWCS